jgi:hypothetical protein
LADRSVVARAQDAQRSATIRIEGHYDL